MNIREANCDEYDDIMRLLRVLNPDDKQLDVAIGQEVFDSIMSSDELKLLVALVDEKIVASCYLNIIPNLTRSAAPYALIENVVTDPAYRDQGIGKSLMQRAIATAFAAGCYKVMLLTGRDESVHTFYRKCGMEKNSKTAFTVRA